MSAAAVTRAQGWVLLWVSCLACRSAERPPAAVAAVAAPRAEALQIASPPSPAVPPRSDFAPPPPVAATLDLQAVVPVALAAPPFARHLSAPTGPLPAGAAPKLVQLRAVSADPTRSLEQPAYRADAPYFLAPVEDGALPAGARVDIPTHFEGEGLRALIPSGEHLLLIYGGRFVVVTRGDAVLFSFDLEAFRHPPRALPEFREFAVQDATYAQIVGDTLYVCNGGGSYAREVFGKKGFVSAIHLPTAALRWRSEALVCDSSFAVYGQYLITGYGFTAEPDFVFVLRLADGETLSKTRVASGPDTITLEGNRVRVEAYAHSYDFELR